jgi:alpha-mannosidase
VPYEPQPDGEYTFMDQGVQHFTYALVPHEGSWETAGTVKHAAELNMPLVGQVETFHDGPLPQRESYLEVEGDSVVITVLKQAEDSNALVLRAFETSNSDARAIIRLPHWHRTIEADFRPSELKTFLVPLDEQEPVREINLIEWDV